MRAEALENPITEVEIWDLANASYPRIQRQAIYQVLHFLLESPTFDLATYSGKDSTLLKPLPAIDQLPTGPENATLQYLLGSVGIPEASYEDNARLVEEWFHQLGLDSEQDKKQMGTREIVTWVGDQLTVDRLRGLFKFRAEDENLYERLDFVVLMFGWFHLQMAYASSLHKQYFGTAQSHGLQQAFLLLEKKGLTKPQVKGPFHHDLEEALYHVAEAHIRVDWQELGRVKQLSDLRSCRPEELLNLAEKIVKEKASSEAMDLLDAKPESQWDEEFRQVVMWNRDMLQYIVLDQAIKSGEVGLMEDMLPHLLFRFLGGGNGKYAGKVLELLQALWRELPPEVAEFIRHHCWLINTTGREGMFCPINKAQEINIKDIKVTYRSDGPNIQWEYMKKLHPAIHAIRAVAAHIKKEFGTLTRGKKHTVPKKEIDVAKLQQVYMESGYHRFEVGRKMKKKMQAIDTTSQGGVKLVYLDILKQWKDLRTFTQSTSERWDDLVGDPGSEE